MQIHCRRRLDMADNITPDEYRAEISMLNHEVYELRRQIAEKQAEQELGSIPDKYDPFDNPTEYPDYSGDYSAVMPQLETPGFRLPVEPGHSEKKRLRHFYTIGGTGMLCHFASSLVLSQAALALILMILRLKNPGRSYGELYSYAYGTSIIIAITAITYLAVNVIFSLIGLKWAKISASELIQTRGFSARKAFQYCFTAVFLQYITVILSYTVNDIVGKYGYSIDISDDSAFARTGSAIAVMTVYSCIIAPITEELFFRGMLLKTFSRANQRFAIIATSVFFGLTHGNVRQFILGFLMGIFLAHITIKHNSLLPSVIVHIFINTFTTIIGALYGKFGENSPEASMLNMFYILISIVGFIMFIEFTLKNKLPRTTPQQSRRGFAVAKTSVPTIAAFAVLLFNMIALIIKTGISQ